MRTGNVSGERHAGYRNGGTCARLISCKIQMDIISSLTLAVTPMIDARNLTSDKVGETIFGYCQTMWSDAVKTVESGTFDWVGHRLVSHFAPYDVIQYWILELWLNDKGFLGTEFSQRCTPYGIDPFVKRQGDSKSRVFTEIVTNL